MAVDLDDGEVGELVGADDLGVHHAAVVEGDLDLYRAFDDVVVGDDVAVRRDDDAGADAVLERLLLLLALKTPALPLALAITLAEVAEGATGSEELREAWGNALILRRSRLSLPRSRAR